MKALDPEEELIQSAYGVLQRLLKNIPPEYTLKIDQVERIVVAALTQHGEHLAVHRIEQKSLDVFKLACWLGGGLLDGIEQLETHQCGIVIGALIKTLREFLITESKWALIMPKSSMALFTSLLLEEKKGNGKHGIWMNGLYVACHCSVSSWREGKAFGIPL